jgi:hypothetical protein
MKIQELSVDDWVFHLEEMQAGRILHIHRIGGIYSIGLDCADCVVVCGINDIAPIAITPKILKMNGWREDKTDPNFFATDEVYIYNHEGVWRLRPKSPELLIVVDIKHVHELQHALRLLGVEKEIEL